MAVITSTLGHVQMVKLLFGQYVFTAKSGKEINYFHCNTVQTTEYSTVSVKFHFHKGLNKPMSYYNAVC
jgi:hypothetical protein